MKRSYLLLALTALVLTALIFWVGRKNSEAPEATAAEELLPYAPGEAQFLVYVDLAARRRTSLRTN